ncbi:unnamed protein product [Urochloa humidicola]
MAYAPVVSPLRANRAGRWACSPTIACSTFHPRLRTAARSTPAVPALRVPPSHPPPPLPPPPPTPPRGRRLLLHLMASPVTAAACQPRSSVLPSPTHTTSSRVATQKETEEAEEDEGEWAAGAGKEDGNLPIEGTTTDGGGDSTGGEPWSDLAGIRARCGRGAASSAWPPASSAAPLPAEPEAAGTPPSPSGSRPPPASRSSPSSSLPAEASSNLRGGGGPWWRRDPSSYIWGKLKLGFTGLREIEFWVHWS